MLTMTTVIVDYTFKMCLWLLYSTGGAPQTSRCPG